MATQPTNKPIGSEDPRDLKFNAGKVDEWATSTESEYTDRKGVKRLTADGMQQIFNSSQVDKEERFNNFLLSSGYQFLGDYELGPWQFSERNQYIRYDGQYWRLAANAPQDFATTGITMATFEVDKLSLVVMDGDTLRGDLGVIHKRFATMTALVNSGGSIITGDIVHVEEFYPGTGGASSWIKTSEKVNPKKTPVELGEFSISDADGYKYTLIENIATGITIEQLGAVPYDNSMPSIKPDNSPFWLLIMSVQKQRAPYRVILGFENRSYYTSKGMVLREWTSIRSSGKYSTQIFVGTSLWSEDEIPHSSTSGTTTWYSLQSFQLGVVHDNLAFTKSIDVYGIDFVTAAGLHTDYGLYTPMLTDSDLKDCRFVGNNIGHVWKDIYSNRFDRITGTARTNTPSKSGAYSMLGRERGSGLGTGTSNIFTRCGWADYTLGFDIEGMSYTAFIGCYTEGALSEAIGIFSKKCKGISMLQWGCERLTSKSTSLPIMKISDSTVDVMGLNLTWNVNVNNNILIDIYTSSKVTISGLNATGVLNPNIGYFLRTDDTSEVVISPVEYPSGMATTNVNRLGIKTTMFGSGGNFGTDNNIAVTSNEFTNKDSIINTVGKKIGLAKWDRQKFKYVYSVGPLPIDAWMNADGTVAYAPS